MSLTTIPKPADRTEWLRERHGYFNASDAGTLFGAHPYRSLADVAVEKLTGPTDEAPTEAMERGNRLEPVLLEWFGDRIGATVITPDVLHVNGRLMATLDGEIIGAPSAWVEAKTTRQHWDEPPEHVYWQVVAQAAASGRERCHVVWLDASMTMSEVEVVPAPGHVEAVLEAAAKFMDFIDLGMTPEGIEMSAENLATLYPHPEPGKLVTIDDLGLAAVQRWEETRLARIDAEKAEKAAKDAVAAMVADAEGLTYDGRLVCTWKANKPSMRLDAKALEADHGDLVATYRREVPGARVLRVTKELSR
jgi:predicted phage-related endonuclease